jgi:Cellulase (glycosyl hydrolase family 5)
MQNCSSHHKLVSRRSFQASLATGLFSDTTIFGAHASENRTDRTIIGVNCFDLFYGLIVDPQRTRHPNARLRELRMKQIPLVRFSCSPFWAKEWGHYQNNRAKYFSAMDSVFEAAETQQIKLVPSLFWNPFSVSDLVREPVSAWAREGSATRDFMRRYTEDVITRYKGNTSILMWEFGNEFNSYADLPNALQWWPKVDVAMGTPASRSKLDLIKASDCASAFAYFASIAKQIDPQRLVGTGADIPNFNAQNLARGSFSVDTESEFRAALTKLTPSGVDVMSIHLYPQREGKYFGKKTTNFASILSEATASAHTAGKKVFIGEFGVPRMTDAEAERQTFGRLLDSIVASKVDWAALWVYDLWNQEKEWSVRFDNDRAWQLELIAVANQRAQG